MFNSGLKAFDTALYAGGLPPGSFLEIAGEPGAGKTGLALWYLRTLLADPEQIAAWIGAETRLSLANLAWADCLEPFREGRLAVVHPCPELPGLEAATELVAAGVPLVVIDSLAALVGAQGESLTRVLAAGLPRLSQVTKRQGAVVIFTNQLRGLGSRITRNAGSCAVLTRLMDVRAFLETGESLTTADVQHGVRIRFHLEKNGPDVFDWGASGRFNCLWQEGLRDLRGHGY